MSIYILFTQEILWRAKIINIVFPKCGIILYISSKYCSNFSTFNQKIFFSMER